MSTIDWLPGRRAQSRLTYRLQRLLLEPRLRFLARFLLPVVAIGSLVSWIYLATDLTSQLRNSVLEVTRSFVHNPDYAIVRAEVTSTSPALSQAVLDAVGLQFPASPFELDLGEIEQRVMSIKPVKTSSIMVDSDGTLQIAITEREPALIWKNEHGARLVDRSGFEFGELVDPVDYPELGLAIGRNDPSAIDEALEIIAESKAYFGNIHGLVRVSERRWDVVLEGDRRILLPEVGPIEAIDKLKVLDVAENLFERDISVFDMRNADRPVFRVREPRPDEI